MPAPDDARVYFIFPEDGAIASSPVIFRFGISGMGVAPAGVEWERTGHHHLLINLDPAEVDISLHAIDQIFHFGGGQTEAKIKLPPGTHTLWLLLP
jgi:uncharacterized protein (DUF1810 family)